MVAKHPLFMAWKFRATVLKKTWPEMLFFTGVAAVVSLVSDLTSFKLSISSATLTVLGTVLGFVISFRTSSAYERYMEGRKLWTTIAQVSRTLAQIIWVHVPFDRTTKPEQQKSTLEIMIEKKSMVNLVQAFSVSVKHLLRGEPGVYYEDLYPLICLLPRYTTHVPHILSTDDMLPLWRASAMDAEKYRTAHTLTSSRPLAPTGSSHHDRAKNESEESRFVDEIYHSLRGRSQKRPLRRFDPELALPVVYSEHPLQPSRNPRKNLLKASLCGCLPFPRTLEAITRPFRRSTPHFAWHLPRALSGKRICSEAMGSNVPLEITLFLSSYLAWLLRNGQLQPATATAFTNGIASLQDTMSNLDRIRDTPLPSAYQVHLHISLFLYLFFLPFQIWAAFGYLTIPATTFASFLLLGFLAIGQEIENPFDYDLNDLDLDAFCLSIQRELHEITAHTCPDPDTYLITAWNQPFAPADRRTAEEMMADVHHSYHGPDTGIQSIRRTLLRSWWDVDQITRRVGA